MSRATAPINLIRVGSIEGNGNIPMTTEPDYTRGKDNSPAVPVAAFPVKNATIELDDTVTTADVQMQGSNGGGVWHDIGDAVPATGAAVKAVVQDDNPWNMVRFVVTGYAGSGEVPFARSGLSPR